MPPNAALVIPEEYDKEEDIFAVELRNPKYDKDEKILKYDVTFLGNVTAPNLADNQEKSVLVIDIRVINTSDEPIDF